MTNLTDITPPVGVAAVSLNVTVTNPVGAGFVTVYPCGALTQVVQRQLRRRSDRGQRGHRAAVGDR